VKINSDKLEFTMSELIIYNVVEIVVK
jgi:hypothetical protein